MEKEYKLPNGEIVKEGDKIQAIGSPDSVYEVYFNGANFCFRTYPYTGDYPANYTLKDYASRVEILKEHH